MWLAGAGGGAGVGVAVGLELGKPGAVEALAVGDALGVNEPLAAAEGVAVGF
jgi:hypothetical protein